MNELRQFNPEMLSKHRVLAVTKSDLLDDELIEMLRDNITNRFVCGVLFLLLLVADRGIKRFVVERA